jgi:peptide/nickel transport system permease protein
MGGYIIRRLLALIPTLFIASIIAFSVVRIIPGDVLDLMLSENAHASGTVEDRQQLERALGLDRPMYVQYFEWIGGAVRGDLGRSLWRNTPVLEQILQRLPVTLEIAVLALFFALLIGIPIGIYSAIRQETLGDHIGRTVSITLLSIPNFFLGTMVVFIPAMYWGWSPPNNLVPFFESPIENLKVFLAPALVLAAALSAIIMRMMRTMMLEVLRQDYIRTAWAKGLRERRVVIGHAVKNALIPVITLVGLMVPTLVSGTVIIEYIFRLPGIGALLLEAVTTRDYPVITGVFLMCGVLVMSVNLIVDLCYGFLDPKVRYDQ